MRVFFMFVMLMIGFAAGAYAGVLDTLKTVASSGSLWAGISALVLAYVFKAIPNQKIYDFVDALFYRLGVVMTLGLGKWKWSAPVWQTVVEPWIVDLIQNTIGAAVNAWIRGIRSDNTNG